MANELEDLIRRIAREEAVKVVLEANRGLTGEAGRAAGLKAGHDAGVICGARDPQRPQRVCLKPRHKGRHKYELQPAPAPERKWEKVPMAEVKQGSRTYVITDKHHPVKVQGLGRAGAAGDGWQVIGLERHIETGEINVEVIKPGKNQRSRVVKLDRIIYKRPKKG